MSASTLAFPTSLEELTPGWLTSALRVDRADFPAIKAAKAIPIAAGKGFLTVMARIELDYESTQTLVSPPRSIVAKMQSPDPTARAICAAMGIWQRECRFYSDLAPRISSRVPRSYFVGSDSKADAHILLLEDLSALTPGDQVAGASIEQAELVTKWLGKFHAACADRALVQSLNWLPTLDQFFAGMQPQLQANLAKFLDVFGSVVTAPRAAWVCDLLPRFSRFDWQSLSTGQGLYDVAWFIVGSFPAHLRRANEHRLLALYRETLLSHGVDPGNVDEVFEEYRRHLLNIIAISPIFAMLDSSSERSMSLFRNWLERIFAAAEDLNIGALIDA
jgi:hypothetical protein